MQKKETKLKMICLIIIYVVYKYIKDFPAKDRVLSNRITIRNSGRIPYEQKGHQKFTLI